MQKNQGILLGVVGTDIPLPELMKLIPKHMVRSAAPVFSHKQVHESLFLIPFLCIWCVQLGIHGYAFAITNNGYILTHPDLRPLVCQLSYFLQLNSQSTTPLLHPVIFFSLCFGDDMNAPFTERKKTQMCVFSEAERIVGNPHLFLWCMHAGIKATHRAGWPDISQR